MILSEQAHIVYCLTLGATTATSTEFFTRNLVMRNYDNCCFIACAGAI